MHKSISWLLVLLIWSPSSTTAQNKNVPVGTSIEDIEEAIAPSLQIRSDGVGLYTNSRVLESIIQAGGDFELNTNLRGATRGITLDFSQPVLGTGPGGGMPIAPANGIYQGRFIAKCHLYGNNLFVLSGGQTVDCPLATSWAIGDATYRIQMNPRNGVEASLLTDFVNITCTGTDAVGCRQWKIEPSGSFIEPDGSLKKRNRGSLIKIVTSKGKTIETNQGDFYFSFQIQFTKQ